MKPSAFHAALCELELEPAQLRADPRGASWLPASLRRAADADPELSTLVAQFVDEELALFDDAAVVDDTCFAARVMARVPVERGVDRGRRQQILMFAYLCAGFVAATWFFGTRAAAEPMGIDSGQSTWAARWGDWWGDSWHAWLDALSVGGVAMVLALAVSLAGLLWPSEARVANG